MSNIIKYAHEQFGEIRICQCDGKEWFCLSDVCKSLDLTTPAKVKQRLSEGGMTTIHTPVTNQFGVTYDQQMTFIDEPNLYRCIFQSRKKEAEQFQTWVFEVVLPQIRRTGGYINVNDSDDDATILSKALMIAQKTLDRKDEIIGLLQPKAQYSDEVLCSVSCLTVTQIAKELGMTGNALNKLLCQKGIQYAQSGQYLLYAEYARKGLAQNRTHMYTNADGQTVTRTYLVWTEAGRDFIHRLVEPLLILH